MKTYIYIFIFFSFVFTGCEDYLDKYPLDSISSNQYWTTAQDLELYVNQYYTRFPNDTRGDGSILDNNSDNLVETEFSAILAGTRVVPASGGGWSWSDIRNVNYFLTHYNTVESPWGSVRQYVGEAYFFRAYFYFNLLRNFGDIPWISEPLHNESEELYTARTPRNIVMDSIVADLDKAILYMKNKGEVSASRLNSQIALLYKSRVCLFEGTWEKYHANTPFGVAGSDGTKYLTLAQDAAKQLIDGELYSIYGGDNPKIDYYQFFGQDDYSNNSEVMLWKKWDIDLGLFRWQPSIWGMGRGITKSLVDDYLCTDGLPISQSSLYQGDNSLNDVVINRDPRLAQTIYLPTDPVNIIGTDITFFEKPDIDKSGSYLCVTGYQLKKYSNRWGDHLKESYYQCQIGSIIFRYAEALLNYIEAKAELGQVTQADIDLTINKLRDRVGMPHLNMDNIAFDPDWDFPSLSPLINEIRRERRVELACEGLRLTDMLRWRSHQVFVNKRPLGMKFSQADFPEMVIGTNVYLDENGYIDPYQKSLLSGYEFNEDRDYLYPIPSIEFTLNSNLSQNPGYDK